MNTNTSYRLGGSDHEKVTAELSQRLTELGTCLRCLKQGIKTCRKSEGLGFRCDNCEEADCVCVYAHSVCSLCDQGSDQRKAVGELHVLQQASGATLSEVEYHQNTLGALHGLKNTIGATRNYWVRSETGEFSVSVLRAIVCSDTDEGRQLASVIKTDVLVCRDRHSDEMAYLTCYKPTRDVLQACGDVKVQIVPEAALKWHSRVEDHSRLERPGCVALNSRGDILVSDLENHTIMMVTTHVPAKVKEIVGIWNEPGRHSTGLGTQCATNCPMQLALLVVQPGKEEYCLFADSGNRVVRLISGVHSFETDQTVQTLTLPTSNPPICPYGLALVSSSVLVISDKLTKRVEIFMLDLQRLCCVPISSLAWSATDGLLAPACMCALENIIYIADVQHVKCIPLDQSGAARNLASSRPALRPLSHCFEDVHGLAVLRKSDGEHLLAVADRPQHKIFLLTLCGLSVRSVDVWGSGSPGHANGPIASASFAEPLGLAFRGSALIVSCYGGRDHGTLNTVTSVDFAVELMEKLEGGYDAVGYARPRSSAEQRAKRCQPLRVALGQYEQLVDYLHELCAQRSAALSGIKSAAGPEMSFDWHSVSGYRISVQSIESIADSLDAMGAHLLHCERVQLYPFLNESRVEYSFGQQIIMSTSNNPSMRQTVLRKSAAFRHDVNLICATSFSNEQSQSRTQYQAPKQTKLVSAEQVMSVAETVFWAMHQKPALAASDRVLIIQQLIDCRRLSSLASPQRTQAVRDKYKAGGYYKPTILVVDVQTDDLNANRFLSIDEALARQGRDRGEVPPVRAAVVHDRGKYLFLPSDIVFVIAGEIQDPRLAQRASKELWWAVKITKAYEKTKTGRMCQVYGQWLELLQLRCWRVTPDPIPFVYFKSLVINPSTGTPLFLRPDELPASLRDNELVYQLPNDLISSLDAAVEADLRPRINDESSGDDSDGEESEQQPPSGHGAAQPQAEHIAACERGAAAKRATRQTTLQGIFQLES